MKARVIRRPKPGAALPKSELQLRQERAHRKYLRKLQRRLNSKYHNG